MNTLRDPRSRLRVRYRQLVSSPVSAVTAAVCASRTSLVGPITSSAWMLSSNCPSREWTNEAMTVETAPGNIVRRAPAPIATSSRSVSASATMWLRRRLLPCVP